MNDHSPIIRLSVISPTADILGNPQDPEIISNKDSQLLYGELFEVEQSHGAYVYGHSVHDGYKGYVERALLVKNQPPANALVRAKATHIYPQPEFKSRPIMTISFMSPLTVTSKTQNGFTQMSDGNWVFNDHIAPMAGFVMPEDMANTALMFLGSPYIFGGRSSFGIDCAGLIQQIMVAHGHPCPPRDSKDQQGAFGESVNADTLQRNDIVYFKGHVGIMMDDRYIINATSRHMATVIEDVRDLEEIYSGITAVQRLAS